MRPWKTLSRTTLLSRKPFFEISQSEVETDKGQIIPDFYTVELSEFVICVPFLENGQILTLRSYKHGAGKISMTFPAGLLDPGETPEDAMKRELLEETGLHARQMVHLGSFIDNGNQVGSRGHYFAALSCTQIQPPDDGDLEVMRPEQRSVAEVDHAILSGDMPILHHVAVWHLARAWQQRAQNDARQGG